MKKERALILLETGLPIGSVDAYIARVNQIPMLTAEEEREFAEALQKNGDVTAAKRLILPHLRYVVSVAKTFAGYGLALADLIQEGNIGLMKAVKRFNPNMGARLVTFAVHWIKSEMHEFIIRNWRIVKIATTKAQRKLFFKLRSSKHALSWFTPAEVTMVAKDLGVKPADVVEMEARLYAHDAAFDGSLDDDDEPSFSPSQYLEDNRLSPHTLLEQSRVGNAHTMLMNALRELSPRDQDIITARWMHEPKATLHDLAAKYSISAERVRQIEKVAMQKLKGLITPPDTEIE